MLLTCSRCGREMSQYDECYEKDPIVCHVCTVKERDELRGYRQAFGELMAIIDRDGGHAQTGDPIRDMMRGVAKVCSLRTDLDDAKYVRDQYDERRRESIAKYEELRLEHQKLKAKVDRWSNTEFPVIFTLRDLKFTITKDEEVQCPMTLKK